MKYKTYYQVFRDISRSVHSSDSLQEVLELIVLKSTEVLNAMGAFLRIRNEENGEFEVAAAYGMGQRYLSKGPVSAEKVLAEQLHPNRVLIIDNIRNAPRVQYPQEAWNEGVRMMLDVPLNVKGRLVGLIRIYLSEKRIFSEDEQDFLVSLAEQCACAISKARSFEIQRTQYDHLANKTEKLSALGRMAAGIAHEINNPLAGILLYGSNMIKKVPEDGPLHQGLEVIIRETTRCKYIIQELLEFSRDREPQKTRSDINGVIEKALKILDNEFQLKHLNVNKDLGEDLAPVLLDVNQLEQVFVNLLINAIHATETGRDVSVSSWMVPNGRLIKAAVEDEGCGIPPEHLARIFEPFYSTKAQGTGLGLSVTYGIIKNHHGDIDVASYPGYGTRVVITLPVMETVGFVDQKEMEHEVGTNHRH